MAECSYCGASESLPFTCKFCGGKFCSEHRLPENHECQGLAVYKETRGREPEKWIYEPFRADAGAVAVQQGWRERLQEALGRLSLRHALYLLLAVLILAMLLRSL